MSTTARDYAGLARLQALNAYVIRLDLTDQASVSGLAWPLDGEASDVVVHNAGVYGPNTSGLQTPSATDFNAVMHAKRARRDAGAATGGGHAGPWREAGDDLVQDGLDRGPNFGLEFVVPGLQSGAELGAERRLDHARRQGGLRGVSPWLGANRHGRPGRRPDTFAKRV